MGGKPAASRSKRRREDTSSEDDQPRTKRNKKIKSIEDAYSKLSRSKTADVQKGKLLKTERTDLKQQLKKFEDKKAELEAALLDQLSGLSDDEDDVRSLSALSDSASTVTNTRKDRRPAKKQQKKKQPESAEFVTEESEEEVSSASSVEDSDSGSQSSAAGKKKGLAARNARKQQKRQEAKSEDDFNLKPRERCVQELSKKYIGYRCIELDRDLHRVQVLIAGYLNLNDTHELRQLIEKMEALARNFLKLKNRGFGVPGVKKGSTYSFQMIVKEISKGKEAHVSWTRLAQVSKTKVLDISATGDGCFSKFKQNARDNSKIFPKAIYLAQIFQVIRMFPEYFPESFQEPKPDQKGRRKGKFPLFGKKKPAPVRYLTDDEVAEITKGTKIGRKEAAVESMAEESNLLWYNGNMGPDLIVERFSMDKITSEDVVDGLVSDDDLISRRITKLAATNPGKSKGSNTTPAGIARPPVSLETVKSFLAGIAKDCNVVHDAFTSESDTTRTEDISVAERTAQEGYQDFRVTQKVEPVDRQFWDLRSKLSTVSAKTSSYADAANLLAIEPDHQKNASVKIVHPKHPGVTVKFVPKHHQVIGTAWQIGMEQGPLGGGILALDCGLGKTCECFYLVFASAVRQLAAYEKYKKACAEAEASGATPPPMEFFDFRPTIVTGPPSTLDSWFGDWRKHWISKDGFEFLTLRIYYGSDKTLSTEIDQEIRLIQLPPDPDRARKQVEQDFPSDDPMSAFAIIWCPYETLSARTLTTTSKAAENQFLASQGLSTKDTDRVTPMPSHLETSANLRRSDHLPSKELIQARDQELRKIRSLAHLMEKSGRDRLDELDSDDDDDETDLMAIEEDDNYTVHTSRFAGLFQRVICDEGHKLKNCRTLNSIAIDKLYAPKKWIVTATPMINRVSDLLGYLYLLWDPAWKGDLDKLDGWNPSGDSVEFYTQSTLDKFHAECPKYMAKYANVPLFWLDPKPYATLVNKGALKKARVAATVLRTLLGLLQLRWTMASKIWLAGNDFYQPGINVPIYHISGVELRLSNYEQAEFNKIWSLFHKFLVKGGGGEGKVSNRPGVGNQGLRDQGTHRHLSVAAFDLRFNSLLIRAQKHGANEIKDWADNIDDHGFTEYFVYTRPIPTLPNPLDRLSVCAYIAMESVKIRYAALHIYNSLWGDAAGNFKGKTTFYTNWPYTQWLLSTFLFNLGLEFYTIWPTTTAAARTEILRKWNDPDDKALFLVLNCRSSALGINLQGACSKLVILDMPDNINTALQIVGRLHRIGQENVQYIWIACVLGTYDQYLFANATAKMLAQIAGEAEFEEGLGLSQQAREEMISNAKALDPDTDSHEAVARALEESNDKKLLEQAEEYIRELLGQRTSRLNWKDPDLEKPHKKRGTPSNMTPARRHDTTKLRVSTPGKRELVTTLRGRSASGSSTADPETPTRKPRAVGEKHGGRAAASLANLKKGKTFAWTPELLYYNVKTGAFHTIQSNARVDAVSGWWFDKTDQVLINPEEISTVFSPSNRKWYKVNKDQSTLQIDPPVLVPGYDFPWKSKAMNQIRTDAEKAARMEIKLPELSAPDTEVAPPGPSGSATPAIEEADAALSQLPKGRFYAWPANALEYDVHDKVFYFKDSNARIDPRSGWAVSKGAYHLLMPDEPWIHFEPATSQWTSASSGKAKVIKAPVQVPGYHFKWDDRVLKQVQAQFEQTATSRDTPQSRSTTVSSEHPLPHGKVNVYTDDELEFSDDQFWHEASNHFIDGVSGRAWTNDDQILMNPESEGHVQYYDPFAKIWHITTVANEHPESPGPPKSKYRSPEPDATVRVIMVWLEIDPPVLVPGYDFPYDNAVFERVQARAAWGRKEDGGDAEGDIDAEDDDDADGDRDASYEDARADTQFVPSPKDGDEVA